MFTLLKDAFSSKGNIRKKILFTLGILIIFRIGLNLNGFSWVDLLLLKGPCWFRNGLFSLLNTFGGGAFKAAYSYFCF